MDNKANLCRFKLLVDRATEILEALSPNERIEATNYALASIKGKQPGSLALTKNNIEVNKYASENAGQLAASTESSWTSNNSRTPPPPANKADLNQNFEKIICKEKLMCEDDDDKTLPISIFKYENTLDNCDAPVITRYNNNNTVSNSYAQETPSSSSSSAMALVLHRTTPGPAGNILREKLLIRHPAARFSGAERIIVDPEDFDDKDEMDSDENDVEMDAFCSSSSSRTLNFGKDSFPLGVAVNKLFIPFLRFEEEFNRNAFKRQILSVLEFAVTHRKPFLRNFFNHLVLSGTVTGVRPDIIERISAIEYKTTPKNGILKPISNNSILNKHHHHLSTNLCTLEELSQDTDSSEDAVGQGRSDTLVSSNNSAAAETPKDNSQHEDSSITTTAVSTSTTTIAAATATVSKLVKPKPTYDCLLCPKTYRKRKSLIDHYKLHPGHCHDCGKPNGLTLEEIKEHNRKHHAKDYPFICDVCGESFSRQQQFHIHVETHKTKDVKTWSCAECGQKFNKQKLFYKHQTESGHKPDGAICEVCGAGFNSKSALCQHMNRVHKKDNSYECHLCQNRFALKANLERHVQLHTEVKRTFICDQCGSSYFTYHSLKEHFSNAHDDTSECKCPLCGKTFSTVKSLQRHQASHSEEKPYNCNICMQSFKWKTHLVRHKQMIHAKPPKQKNVKRFAKNDKDLVPVEISPPPAKSPRKSNNKPKSTSSASKSPPSAGLTTPPAISTPHKSVTPQLESQTSFPFTTENILGRIGTQRGTTGAPDGNLILGMNKLNSGAEGFRFEATQAFKSPQRIPMQTDQQMMSYEAAYQQQQQHHQQQSQSHAIQSQQQHLHQPSQHPPHPSQQHPQSHPHQRQHPHQTQQQHGLQHQQHSLQQTQQHPHQPQQHPHPHSHAHQTQQQHPAPPAQHQQYPCAPLPSNEWPHMNFNNANQDVKDKYYSVIEVNSNDFMGLPMTDMPKNEATIDSDLLNFQNMWSANSQQLNFNSGNSMEQNNSYNNIGSILTNLELIGNNSSMEYNYEMIGEQHIPQQQHNPYIHPELYPNPAISYDYSSQSHTITDISNTILRDGDQKPNFQYQHPHPHSHQQQQHTHQQHPHQQHPHQQHPHHNPHQQHQPSSYEHPGPSGVSGVPVVASSGGSGPGGSAPGSGSNVYSQRDEKVVLPPLSEYLQHHQPMQQENDVNIVYYPGLKEEI